MMAAPFGRFFCGGHIAVQVNGPTHTDRHLLDLVISDLQPRSVEIINAILDHNMVWACLDIGIFESTLVIRKSSIMQWQTGQA